MDCTLVSHTHWDREWYRTFQSFRASLVDAIDQILDMVRDDPEFRFLLDGQTIVLEDYLEIRPERRPELEDACRQKKIAIGPWYVQPDSLLPSGETHIRNLLEGRRVGQDFGGVSSVAYTPDSFGHPAQFPQIFAGFGLGPFVYWRGNGSEIDALPAEYRWEAPDGSSILCHHLAEGYFGAAGLPEDPISAAVYLQELAETLLKRTENGRVLFMNGIDHAVPAPGVGAILEVLRRTTGWTVRRGVLEDFADGLDQEAPVFHGELVGGRLANLLPGVWSARLPLKLRNREAEATLLRWAEPWAALARRFGLRDERASLRTAWRAFLCNQAHDSICGCSQDRVHDQSETRYDTAIELGHHTAKRCLERMAGLATDRRAPWDADLDVAVFNPSPHPRSDVVRFPLEADPWVEYRGDIRRSMQVHPLLGGTLEEQGYTVDGEAARVVGDPAAPRLRLDTQLPPRSVEMVVRDVPAFGWRRLRLSRSAPHRDEEDDGREISTEGICVRAETDGRLEVRLGARTYKGLLALEDQGDRGDTYDFDPVEGGLDEPRLESVRTRRRRHSSGIQSLEIERVFSTPRHLLPDRETRSPERVESRLTITARIAPGVPRVDLDVCLENAAMDHRLRLRFPTGERVEEFFAETTSDIARRQPETADASGWVHPAPRTFVQQGFVCVGGLTVGAPGLPECEVTPEGDIALTLLRSVGWLALYDLKTRPIPAGPIVPTPGAQCLGTFQARLCLVDGFDPRAVRDFESGFLAVAAGEAPLVAPGVSLCELESEAVLLEAFKPSSDEEGVIVRLLNPGDQDEEVVLATAFGASEATAVGLDEQAIGAPTPLDEGRLRASVPAHALRSFCLK